MAKVKLIPEALDAAYEVPRGMVFTGKVVQCTDGSQLPVFESAPPKPGRLSINTLEGWNALCREDWIRNARRRLGYEPAEDDIQEQRDLERRYLDAVRGVEDVTPAELHRRKVAAFGPARAQR